MNECGCFNASMNGNLRRTGIDVIGDVPWSTHFCQFYQTKQDLLDTLIPYIKNGLESNEFCMCVTADNLPQHEAEQALRAAIPNYDAYVERGAMVLLPYTEWYIEDGAFDRYRVLDSWVEKLDAALAMGLDGARVTGDTMWLNKAHWKDFTDYEASINTVIGGKPLLVLCTYALDKCGAEEIADVIVNHEFALMKRYGEWHLFESSSIKKAKLALQMALSEIEDANNGLAIANDKLEQTNKELLNEIAERKQAESALIEARSETDRRLAQLESSLASVWDGIMLLETSGNVAIMNDCAKQLMRNSLQATLIDRIQQFQMAALDGTPLPLEETVLHPVLLGESVRDMRCKSIQRNGREIILSINSSPVKNKRGRIIGATVVFRDITDQVEFDQQKDELFKREHNIANVLQQTVIPSTLQSEILGYGIAVNYRPALNEAEIGGDFYDVFELADNKLAVLIGDVSGKGLQAALRVVSARHAIRSYAYLDPRPGRVMSLANEALCRESEDVTQLLTAFLAILDPEGGTITYTSAGHEPPIVRNVRGGCDELSGVGLPLGLRNDVEYGQSTRRLDPGDLVVLVTDGITEARAPGPEFFGVERLIAYVEEHISASPEELVAGILDAATAHAGGRLQDDAAVVIFTPKGDAAEV